MNSLKKKIEIASKIWKDNGWQGIKKKISHKFFLFEQNKTFQYWVKEYDTLADIDRQQILQHINGFLYKPLISVIIPVYNIEEKWLRLCIESVRHQLYDNWELCIADDCSTKPHIRKILEEYQKKDSRIKVIFRKNNGHISAASNSALEIANGDFTVLLDHDDELSEHALYFVVNELNCFPQTQMIYSDEDMINEKGKRYNPKFKPDWSLDFFYSLNLITHLSAYRTELFKKIGGFKIGAEGSQDYDLALRVIEEINENQIRHIPHILYHWRAIRGSVALDLEEKPYAHERARESLRQHFYRIGVKAQVIEGYKPLHRVIYDSDTNFEVIQSSNPTATSLNLSANNSLSEVLIFVDGDIEKVLPDSFKELSRIARQEKVGAVGGKIVNANGTVCNGGIILGVDGKIGFAHEGFPVTATGNNVRGQVINNFSAVSGVLAIRRQVFQELGGFDNINFDKGLYEIDLCFRLREKGLRIVFTPYSEFIQKEKSVVENILKDGGSLEFENLKKKWKHWLEKDEFYNENLSLKNGKFLIEIPPRIKKPWRS